MYLLRWIVAYQNRMKIKEIEGKGLQQQLLKER